MPMRYRQTFYIVHVTCPNAHKRINARHIVRLICINGRLRARTPVRLLTRAHSYQMIILLMN